MKRVARCLFLLSLPAYGVAHASDDLRARLTAAENSLRLHDVRRAQEWLDAVPETARAFEWRWLSAQTRQFEQSVSAHSGRVNGLCVSPDQHWLVSTGADKKVLRWAIGDLKFPLEIDGHAAAVWHCEWAPDSQSFATVGSDGVLKLRDANGTTRWSQEKIGQGMASLAFHPDGTQIVTSTWRANAERGVWGELQWWDARTGKLLRKLEHAVKPLVRVRFTHDGSRVLVGDWDDHTAVFAHTDGQLLQTLKPPADLHYKAVQSLAISPDDSHAVVVGKDGAARLWSLADGQLQRRDYFQSEGEHRWLNDVLWLDKLRWITAGNDASLRLWSRETQSDAPLATWHGPDAGISALARAGDALFSGDNQGRIQRWSLPALQRDLPWRFGEAQYDLAFSPDGKQFAITGWKGGLQKLDRHSGASTQAIAAHGTSGVRVDWSQDGKWLASTGNDGLIKLWHASDLRLEKELPKLASGRSNAVAFSPDSQFLAAAAEKGKVQIWRLPAMEPVKNFAIGQSSAQDLRWHADGKKLVAAGSDGVSWLLPLDESEPVLLSAPSAATAVVFSKRRQHFISAHADGALRVWSESGVLKNTLSVNAERINTLALSNDETRLALGGEDGVVSLLDAGNLKLLVQPRFPASVWQLKFTPDDQALFVLALDKQLYRLQAR